MFTPDQPITTYKDDLLERNAFAQSLGEAILSYKEKDSIALGLYGEWGSGKTSLLNMALEYIQANSKKSNNETIIIRFNPWNFSDQNQLIHQFFRQLSVVLRRPDYAGDAKKAGEQLETYAKFFEPLALIPTVGPFAFMLSSLFKSVGGASKSWGDLKSNDLNATRTELNELLRKQPYKIVIVIDDIDRLNNVETRQVFQLIKSLGDFPNTIYLLAFDKNVVINALKNEQEGSGLEYLEKIIQVSFEVPLMQKNEVQKIFFAKLNEILVNIPDNRFNQTYWANIFNSGIKYFIENIRDVNRYINTLRFNYNLIYNEINVVDLIAITGIQVFAPELYHGIRSNKDIFSGAASSGWSHEKDKDTEKDVCDKIIGREDKLFYMQVIELLKRMFPKLESIYGNTYYDYNWLHDWRKDCRICSPKHFDIYFRLAIEKENISRAEIESIIKISIEPDPLTEVLMKLNQEGKIIKLLEQLEDYTQEGIPIENIETIIEVIIDIGDLFLEEDSGMYGFDTPLRISRIINQLSHRYEDKTTRFQIYKKAIEKATRSLYTIVHEVSLHDQEHGKYGLKDKSEPEDRLTINSEQLIQLEQIALSQIERWADNGKLKGHKHLVSILYRWKDWGQMTNVQKFIYDSIKDDDDLIDFVTCFLSKSLSQGITDYVAKTNWHVSLKTIGDFIDVHEIEPRCRAIRASVKFTGLMGNQQLALSTFLDTFDGKIKDNY